MINTRRTMVVVTALLISMMCLVPNDSAATNWIRGRETPGDAGAGVWAWKLDANWSDSAPASGDTANYDDGYVVTNGIVGIDVKDAMNDLGAGGMKFGYGNPSVSFFDSDQLTPINYPLASQTDFNLGGHASLEAAAAASTSLTVTDLIGDKSGQHGFFVPLNITGNFEPYEQSKMTLYGPATINQMVKDNRNKGWGVRVDFRNSVSITNGVNGYRSDNPTDGAIITFHGATTIGTWTNEGASVVFNNTASGSIDTLSLQKGWVNLEAPIDIGTLNLTTPATAPWGVLDITTAGSSIVGQINIDGVDQGTGTWGKIGSSGGITPVEWITGDGTLTVVAPPTGTLIMFY